MRRLPTFKGYTIDLRLRQVRRMVYGEVPEFYDFDSPKGWAIFVEWEEAGCPGLAEYLRGGE